MSCDLPGAWGTLETFSVGFLWAAVLLRARPAVRNPHQRGLWLAVASAAVAMTLHLGPVSAYAAELTGSPRAVALAKNQVGVMSAAAVLHFAVYATRGRRHTGTVLVAMITVMAALLALAGLGAAPAPGHGPPFTLARPSSAAYWLLLITAHVVACAACVRVCWTYGRRGPHASVNLGLTLFGWGTALAGLFWLTHYFLLAAGSRPGVPLCLIISLHAVLRAAALLVPTVMQLRHTADHARTIWRIWPLWRDLVDAVPHVALSPTRSRLLVLLQPQLSWRLIAYRKVIEVRDVILVLSHYTDPGVSRSARAHVVRCGIPADHADAYVTACVLSRARAAKLAGAGPDPAADMPTSSQEAGDLAAETAFLLLLTEAYLSPCVKDFGPGVAAAAGYRRRRRPVTLSPPCPKPSGKMTQERKAVSAMIPTMDSTLRRTYPHYAWRLVNEGDSGAFVYHLTGHRPELYAKIAPRTPENPAFDLVGEADRLEWLAHHGIPVPRIVERGADDTTVWLVTEAVPGAAASEEWPEHQRTAVVEAIAELARTLHELPVDDCPFDRRLDVAVAEARHNVREGLVDLDDLQDEHAGWTGDQLLAELDRARPEKEDLVVCHGDLCPNNVLLDPETCQVTGVIDVGRLGVADRHADLALAARELEIDEDPWFGPAYAERFLEQYGAHRVDKDKMAFYQLLDEFF